MGNPFIASFRQAGKKSPIACPYEWFLYWLFMQSSTGSTYLLHWYSHKLYRPVYIAYHTQGIHIISPAVTSRLSYNDWLMIIRGLIVTLLKAYRILDRNSMLFISSHTSYKTWLKSWFELIIEQSQWIYGGVAKESVLELARHSHKCNSWPHILW